MPPDEFAPAQGFIESNTIFAVMIGFIIREMIAKRVTTEEAALMRVSQLTDMMHQKGASAGAAELLGVLAHLVADTAPER